MQFPIRQKANLLIYSSDSFWGKGFYPSFPHVLHSYPLIIHSLVHKVIHIV